MSDPDRLNSLSRFRKQSDRLVLEAHGHCEVPAGCGGVVLRWRNPVAVIPVVLSFYAPVRARCFIDGEQPKTSRLDLAPGCHVFAAHLEDTDLTGGLIMFAAVHDPSTYGARRPGQMVEEVWKAVSADNGSWRYTVTKPEGEDWIQPNFNDRSWGRLVAVPAPTLQWEDFGVWSWRRCTDNGAACLGLPRPCEKKHGELWVRTAFEVPAPRREGPRMGEPA